METIGHVMAASIFLAALIGFIAMLVRDHGARVARIVRADRAEAEEWQRCAERRKDQLLAAQRAMKRVVDNAAHIASEEINIELFDDEALFLADGDWPMMIYADRRRRQAERAAGEKAQSRCS